MTSLQEQKIDKIRLETAEYEIRMQNNMRQLFKDMPYDKQIQILRESDEIPENLEDLV